MTFRMHDFKDLIKGNHHKRCIITKLLTLLGVSIQIRKWCIQMIHHLAKSDIVAASYSAFLLFQTIF